MSFLNSYSHRNETLFLLYLNNIKFSFIYIKCIGPQTTSTSTFYTLRNIGKSVKGFRDQSVVTVVFCFNGYPVLRSLIHRDLSQLLLIHDHK